MRPQVDYTATTMKIARVIACFFLMATLLMPSGFAAAFMPSVIPAAALKITYPGVNNFSTFGYDGMGRNVKIVETVAGTITSTNQFVWCGSTTVSEARDGTGAIRAQYFSRGQTIGGSVNKYCYTFDHLGSVRELTDSSGFIQAQYSYDPYGQVTKLQGNLASDFQYACYYFHAPSGFGLTATRAYSSGLGRFINRDPIEEDGGANLYGYVHGNPISGTDPLGLWDWGSPQTGKPDPSAPMSGSVSASGSGGPPLPGKPGGGSWSCNGPSSGAPNSGGPPNFGSGSGSGGGGGGGGGGHGDGDGGPIPLNTVPPTFITPDVIKHILDKHRGAAPYSNYFPGTDWPTIRGYIEDTINKGVPAPNPTVPGIKYTHVTMWPIGYRLERVGGVPFAVFSRQNSVGVDAGGFVRTSFPGP